MNFSRNYLILVFVSLLFAACNSEFKYNVETSPNGVKIDFENYIAELEVVDESIIHVKKYSSDAEPIDLPDYVTVLEAQDVHFSVKKKRDMVTIATAQVKVTVNADGIIAYHSANGKELLKESDQGVINTEASAEHKVSQAFVAGDEALYGLGQFQSGIMNWKNVPIRLQQFNQEIAIPFVVSTKGYGIYWHNYSLTDFNMPDNEISFAETDVAVAKDEKESNNIKGEKEDVASHITKQKVAKNTRETTFTPDQTGEYTFLVVSDNDRRMRGTIKVSIDGDDIINYSTIWVPRRYSGKKYLEAGKEYRVVFQNAGAKILGQLFYNKPDFNKTVFSSTQGNVIDYYVMAGENPQQVIAEYQKLTGKAPLFPKSAYGFWQCRERYHNQQELLENAHQMREREIPFDNIVQDWFYWPEGTKGPQWDRVKYPDPKGMVDELKALNLKLMVSVWPELRNAGIEERYGLRKIGKSNIIDIYDPAIREGFYRVLSDSMFSIGVNSIWLDGSEPENIHNSTASTAVAPWVEVQNPYALEVTRAVYEGRRKEFPDERVFNLTRSAYAGQQRYAAACWSGDVEASWEQLSEQIAAGLNFTMAGLPYWSHDIGGFFRDSKSINKDFDNQYTNPEFIELLTRWFQFGAFSPIFRIHGYKSETEIWRYGQEFENMARKFIDLRYQLMPYIYSEARKVSDESQLLMSPLAYYYPNDKKVWGIKDQLFFGESLMLAFVTEYKQRSKTVYLPTGEWFNFWTNEKIGGDQEIEVHAPYDETPIFVKAGSILPLGPKVQYATEETDEPILLKIYPGKEATYTLYYDDNESYAYENGVYSEIKLSYSEKTKELSINSVKDEYIDFSTNPQSFIVEIVGESHKKNLVFKGDLIKSKL